MMYCVLLSQPISLSLFNYNIWYREMSVYADCFSSRPNIAVKSNHFSLVVHVYMKV